MPLGRDGTVTKEALLEKIEALPPEKKAAVEDFVDFVSERVRRNRPELKEKAFPDELLKRIDDRRERLLREHGLFSDSTEIVRELRENGD